jgi:pSer/pThr/pTyr-binding forkhead associated (FHA) protein
MTTAKAFLKALTPEARACLRGSLLELRRYPFRVGRESREHAMLDYPRTRRNPGFPPSNDLYLLDPGPTLNVSREHFQIDLEEGQFYLLDRGSSCGTLVEGEFLGTQSKSLRRKLESHDVIVVGTSISRYVFKFLVA